MPDEHLRPATPFLSVIQQICFNCPVVCNYCFDGVLELHRIESRLDLAIYSNWHTARFLAEDSSRKVAVCYNAFIHTHLESAEHNRDQSWN
jgi:hypothetical protein